MLLVILFSRTLREGMHEADYACDNVTLAKFCIIPSDRRFAAFFGVIKLINHLSYMRLCICRVSVSVHFSFHFSIGAKLEDIERYGSRYLRCTVRCTVYIAVGVSRVYFKYTYIPIYVR